MEPKPCDLVLLVEGSVAPGLVGLRRPRRLEERDGLWLWLSSRLEVRECPGIRCWRISGGDGVCERAGAGVSIVENDEDDEVGDKTNRDEVGVCTSPSSSVVGGNESGDGVDGRLWL